MHCLHPVQAFDDGAKLLEAAEQRGLEGIVSKRQASAYSSGPSRDWVKIKTATWRAANPGAVVRSGSSRMGGATVRLEFFYVAPMR